MGGSGIITLRADQSRGNTHKILRSLLSGDFHKHEKNAFHKTLVERI